MSSFTHLAQELVEAILAFVDQSDLLNLCLTCHEMLPLARRCLFRHIVLKDHKESTGRPVVETLLSVLNHQPSLATCVQKLELLGEKPDFSGDGYTQDEVFPSGYRPPITDWVSTFVQPLKSYADNAYVDFIFQLHNLRDLTLGLTFSALALKFDRRFHRLHRVVFGQYPDLREDDVFYALHSIDPHLFRHLYHLPALAILELEVPYSQLVPIQFGGLPYALSLKSLTLRSSFIDPKDLTSLLAKTPNLERFYFRFYDVIDYPCGPLSPHRSPSVLHIDQLCVALLEVSESLKYLKVSLQWTEEEAIGPEIKGTNERALTWGPMGYLDSLDQFRNLEHLDIPLVALLGYFPESSPAMILPPHLRQLRLSDDLADWHTYQWHSRLLIRRLRLWLQEQPKTTPFLEQIVLEFHNLQHPYSDATPYWALDESSFGLEFHELCESAGIKGVIDLQVPLYEPRPEEIESSW